MANLNHSFNQAIRIGSFGLFLFFYACRADSRYVPLFQPFAPLSSRISVQTFVANDPVSVKSFVSDWHGPFYPRIKDNMAFQSFRIDTGKRFRYGYIGYFYQNDLLLRASPGLVEGYYILKNDISVPKTQHYNLTLQANGITQHGIVVSHDTNLIDTRQHRMRIAASGYFSLQTDMQKGSLTGNGSIMPKEGYSAIGFADYFFSDNLLYDGWDVGSPTGWGYGFHVALRYDYQRYRIQINAIVNDLFAHSYWHRIPHSLVHIKTENHTFNKSGYIVQKPTAWGSEHKVAYRFTLPKKYHVDIRKTFDNQIVAEIGYETVQTLAIPYVRIAIPLQNDSVSFGYEARFRTISFGYDTKRLHMQLTTNGLADASSIGVQCMYILPF